MADEHSGSSRAAAAPQQGQSAPCADQLRAHPALVPRPARDGAAVHPARRRACSSSPTGCSTRRRRAGSCSRPAPSRAPTPSSASATRRSLKETRHRGASCARPPARPRTCACCASPASGVDIAFVQGGADDDRPPASDDSDADDGLVSLGSLFYEPVWLFYRERRRRSACSRRPTLTSLSQLAGWRVNIGAPRQRRAQPDAHGCSRPTASTRRRSRSLREPQTPAVVGLLDGRIDALVFASAPESLMVQMLLQTPGIRLFDFAQAEAYSRRFPFLSPVTLPRGVVDLARDIPPADVRLVAPTATLVARAGHPSGADPAVRAGGAAGARRRRLVPAQGRLPERDATPSGRSPRKRSASTRSGPPVLQRYLPFWLANLVDRMWVVLVSIIAVLIPLSRMVPPLYEFRVRSRIFRWYGQLRDGRERDRASARPTSCCSELAEIERRVEHVTVPLSYADELYSLRTPHPPGRRAAGRSGARSLASAGMSTARAAARPRHRLRLRRPRGGARAVEGRGRDHARRPHQPSPVPAAALPGRDRRPERAGGQRADPPHAAPRDAARQPDRAARPRCATIDVAARTVVARRRRDASPTTT